jgi:hypothetical protein
MMPPHQHVIVPVADLITGLRAGLAKYTISPAAFEEIVRQCFDVYMDWKGNEDVVLTLPFFNRIEIPELRGPDYEDVYQSVQYHVHVFARALFSRLMEHGLFPQSHMPTNMDFAFLQFVDNDVMLQYFPF